jgi:hypothetical protein
MGLEEEIRKDMDEATSAFGSGIPVRPAIPSAEDSGTRLMRLQTQLAAQREAILRLARKLDDLAAKSG